MKNLIISILLLKTIFSFSQNHRAELANSNFLYSANYINEVNDNTFILKRNYVSDTVINNTTFKKYKLIEFTDYNSEQKESIYYESFKNLMYLKLDQYLKPIHSVQLDQDEQEGIIFGNKKMLKLEYVDTRTSYPRDSLIPDDKTPRKYYSSENPNEYFIITTDFKINHLEFQNSFYTKHLIDDVFWRISESFDDNTTVKNNFSNTIGDEVQIFYKRKWYNDSTGKAEYQDKQFKTFTYTRDSILNNQKGIILTEYGYNFLSGNETEARELFVAITDTAYHMNGFSIPIKEFKREANIQDDNSIFLQAITPIKIGNKSFPVISQYYSQTPYVPTILPFFPMAFIEAGNVKGYVSYAKLNGQEYGVKAERDYIKDRSNIWSIRQLSPFVIELSLYLKEASEIEIELGHTDPMQSVHKGRYKQGVHKLLINEHDLESKTHYKINFIYKSDTSSGNQLMSFTTN